MYESGDVDYDDEGDDDDNDDDENDEDDDWEREKLISLWQLRPFCSRDPIGAVGIGRPPSSMMMMMMMKMTMMVGIGRPPSSMMTTIMMVMMVGIGRPPSTMMTSMMMILFIIPIIIIPFCQSPIYLTEWFYETMKQKKPKQHFKICISLLAFLLVQLQLKYLLSEAIVEVYLDSLEQNPHSPF